MPSAGTVHEFAAAYGALDSVTMAQGRSGDAHVLREIARNNNRLARTGGPMLTMAWRVDGAVGENTTLGAMAEWATWPSWTQIIQGPIPAAHKPGLTSATAKVWASITNGASVYLQIGTSARPFDPAPILNDGGAPNAAPNAMRMVGTGSAVLYTLTGIPIGSSELEWFDFYMSGEDAGTLASGIGTNTGVVDAVPSISSFVDTGATATAQLRDQPGRYRVSFEVSGHGLGAPRTITGATDAAVVGGIVYQFSPPVTQQESRILVGSTFNIREPAAVRFLSIAVYEEDVYT